MKRASLRALALEHEPRKSVVDWLQHRAAHEPARVAFTFLGERSDDVREITYLELDRRARTIAAQLIAAGAAGQRALLLHPPGLEYIAALYACFYAQVIAVPAYPPRTGRTQLRLRSIVGDAGTRFALSTRPALEQARTIIAREPALSALSFVCTDEANESGDAIEKPKPSDEIVLLQYTSGSTSEPKGVMLTHRHFARNIEQILARRAANRDDRIVLWLPPYHDMGLIMGILLPVFAGIQSILMSPSSFLQRPGRWLETMSQRRGTISGSPNFGYELCVRRLAADRRAGYDLSAWRVAFNGAERVSPETMARFAEAFAVSGFAGAALTPCYGLAEATLAVAFGGAESAVLRTSFDLNALFAGHALPAQLARPERTLLSSGRPLDGIEVRIVEPRTQRVLPDGEVGEIWLHGANIAAGYLNKPELSEQLFRAKIVGKDGGKDGGKANAPSYLRTGDLGFVLEGELFVVGRLKDLLIIAGTNYYPEDIEAVVREALPEIDGAIAAFSVDAEGGERLIVALEADPRKHLASELMSRARRAIAEALELPVHDIVIVRRATLPKTSSGKLQRGQCRQQYQAGELQVLARISLPPIAPDSPEQAELVATLQAMLASLLGVDRIEPHEDLFTLGGHSLIVTQLVSRVRDQLRIDLDLRTVFEAPTPLGLAERIAELPRLPAPPLIEKLDRAQRLQLSFSQERMWFQHQLEPSGAAYNVSGAARVEGELDSVALERALGELVRRHEILRTNYPSDQGEPRIAIAVRAQPQLAQHDLRGEPEPEAAALALASRLAGSPFDVAREPLLRAALYRTGEAQHVLCVSMHHLVTDAWSMGVLVDQLRALYEAFRRGAAPPPETDGLAYIDYAAWQRKAYDAAHFENDLAYWRRQLEGVEPLELPTDRPRPHEYSSRGALEPLVLSDALLDALRALGAQKGATLFMVMLAAWKLLLHRYTQQNDIVVGVPIANRNQLCAEPFIGTLVNTLPLRLQIDPQQSFSALLAELREVALEAYAHQDLPFERMVQELSIERNLGRSPLIQVMFDFQNAPLRADHGAALSLEPLILSRGAAQFDLTLLVLDTELGKTAGLEYRTDLFDAATMQRLLGHYLHVLESVVENPNRTVGAIRLMRSEERALTIAAGRSPSPPRNNYPSLPALFAQEVARTPSAPAVLDAEGQLSYAELDARSDALARRLRTCGAYPGERVAVYLGRSCEIVVALLAVLKSGAAYVPLDPRYPAARLQLILEDSDPLVIVTEARLSADLPPGFVTRALAIDRTGAEPSFEDDELAIVHDSAAYPAYVIYTSGTTGKPKGVEVSVAALSNFLLSMARLPGIRAGERLVAVTTVAFDIAGLELFLPLITGASVYVAAADVAGDGQRLGRLIADQRPSLMQATPATWRMLVEAGWAGDRHLTILCGGEVLPRELADALLERSAALFNMYGPTETTIWSTLQRVTAGEGPLPIGAPIDATSVYVLDELGELLPLGIPGELCIGGAGVANGYFRRPELTAQRFAPDRYSAERDARLYRTGDRAHLRANGTLYYQGRFDHQIKIRGHRVEPGEIESVLKEELGFSDVVVIARENRPGDVRLIAYYVHEGQPRGALDELRQKLRKRLPDYMVPSVFVALAKLPQTPSGKVDRKALPRPDLSSEVASEYEAPRDVLESELVRIWEEILTRAPIGVRDNFFRLGGHSLLAVRLFARIESEFGVELPLATVLEAPTLSDLADAVRRAQEAAASPAIAHRGFRHLVSLRAGNDSPPLFCVHGAGGSVLNLHPLARHLGGTRALYGLAAAGIDGIGPPASSIEAMAQAYLHEIRQVARTGPYHLAGYCGGGLVAFEMARMLIEDGERVGVLALIDCYRPGIDTRIERYGQIVDGIARQGLSYVAGRAGVWFERNRAALTREAQIKYHLRTDKRVPFELRDFWLTSNFFDISRTYRPEPYPGRLTILYAAERVPLLAHVGPDLGWTALVHGALESHEVPGDHDTLAKEPHVRTLAAKLRAAIETAEERARDHR